MGKVGLVDHMDLIHSLYSWWESFGSSLATLPPGFQLCFFFFSPLPVDHPLGFAPEAILEDLGCPGEDQLWRCCSCLGLRGSGSTRYSGE